MVRAKSEITISRIVDIDKVIRYYLLQSSTLSGPDKPTVYPPEDWSTTEPTFESELTKTLYFVDCTVYTNGTFQYSEVSKSTSYEAAKEALNKANDVQSNLDDETSRIYTELTDQRTDIINDVEDITASALKEYTSVSEFETYKKMMESEMMLTANNMSMQFTQTNEKINNTNESLQNQINKIQKCFTFDMNGLTIGQSDNPYKMVLNNDRFSMMSNNSEVMWIANGKVYTPFIEIVSGLKMLGYELELDAHGNLNCGYVGV